jgi:hypothetical protein
MLTARRHLKLVLVVSAALASCSEPTKPRSDFSSDLRLGKTAPTSTPTVTSTQPAESPRGITLDVQINGSGFDNGSKASMPLHGVLDDRVRVNSTRYVKATQVVANVTLASDAVLDRYDVVVTTTSGKKGIGTEAFTVQLQPEALVNGYHVRALNEAGVAAGDVTNLAYPGACPTPSFPGVWRVDGSRAILPMGIFCGGSAQAINVSGVVLGSLIGGPSNSSGLWFPSGNTYTLQLTGSAPDGYRPLINGGLNDNNEVFGWGQFTARLYWWSVATGWLPMQVPPGATLCQAAKAINNRGELAAMCTVGGVGNPYYWSSHDAAPIPLPRPAGTGDAYPRDMNDNGVIVGSGLRWRPTSPGYALDVFTTGSAEAIASDGTMAGSITNNPGSNGPVPAIFYSPTSYQMLGLTSSGKWGSTAAIALTPNGIVVGGTEQNAKALRWRVP